MKNIKVMVIDDSKFIKTVFAGILDSEPDLEVVDTTEYKDDIHKKIKLLSPDVITLDVEVRNLDGLSFIESLMKHNPLPVIIVSAVNKHDADLAISALEFGAVDYIAKPNDIEGYKQIAEFGERLVDIIRVAASCNVKNISRSSRNANTVSKLSELKFKPGKVIAMGGAMGGIEAIREILTLMPKDCPPIVITQYITEGLTKSLANRLNGITTIEVKEATHGEKLMKGHAYISPSNRGMRIINDSKNGYLVNLSDSDYTTSLIDVLFESIATSVGDKAIGVILSGSSNDGVEGLLKMRDAGGFNIGQSQDSCIVYIKPKAALDKGAINETLPIYKIAEKLCSLCAG